MFHIACYFSPLYNSLTGVPAPSNFIGGDKQ
uniref:Uncharacterized protein n=1 Tax=Myoviridae sp. ct8iP21 TaxID=2825041 RepID=A0A8S5V4H1_9CAUD|nr:MAG TPA: hypothetical protein [Myoviridae sp. ct8iP21]